MSLKIYIEREELERKLKEILHPELMEYSIYIDQYSNKLFNQATVTVSVKDGLFKQVLSRRGGIDTRFIIRLDAIWRNGRENEPGGYREDMFKADLYQLGKDLMRLKEWSQRIRDAYHSFLDMLARQLEVVEK